MKNIFLKWLIALLPLIAVTANAQRLEIDLTPVNSKIDALEKRVKALEKGEIIVTKPGCERGPTVGKITDISTKGITVEWDGKDVFHLKYTVSGMGKMYVDSVKPESSKIKITFPAAFPNGIYTATFEGLNCTGVSSGQFTIAGGVDPPSNAACDPQPTFKINGFTNQNATIQFDAVGLTDLTLSVVQGDNIFKATSYHPDVNTLFFKFDQVLPVGDYKIKLTPVSCSGVPVFQDFTIKYEDAGAVDPPIVTDPGNSGYKLITKGMPGHISLTHRVVGDIDYITDNTANDLQSKYEYRYVIGADVVLRQAPLKDYPFAINNGFRVVKFLSKKGISSINQWPGQGESGADGGYYQNDAGQSFQYNATAGVETGFYGSQSGFVNHIPGNYNPLLQMPQWADIVPDLKLPKGHFFVLDKGDWSIDQVLKKGVTHISHFRLPRPGGDESQAVAYKKQGITYSDVPTSFMLFGNPLPVNPTNEQVDALVARHNLTDALAIWETMEQAHSTDPNTSTWIKRFNEGYAAIQKKNFIDKGIPALFAYNYFQFWPSDYHLGQVSPERSKLNFRTPLDKLQKTNFSPGGTLSPTTLIVEAVYLGAPDIQQSQPLDLAYKLSLFKYMGYEGGVFLAGEHEWRPNNFFEYTYPEGKLYGQGKIPLDPNTLITSTFFSQVYGKVFVQWGGSGKINAGRIFDSLTPEPIYWLRNGATEMKGSTRNPDPNAGRYQYWIASPDFPHSRRGGVGYYGYNGNTDLARFALQVYADTWGQVGDDGSKNYLSFRIDGGNWIEAVNQFADDLVDANVQKRGFVYSNHKSGQIAWFYLNPFADNLWHDLEVRFPNGRIARNRVAGNGIHAKIESL